MTTKIGLVGLTTRNVGLLIHSVGLLVCRTIVRRHIEMTPERWWFTLRAHQILSDLYPETEFKFIDLWFGRCSKRKWVLFENEKTRKSQNDPAAILRLSIQQFHAKFLRERKRGNYEKRDLANMGQTSFLFVIDVNKPAGV